MWLNRAEHAVTCYCLPPSRDAHQCTDVVAVCPLAAEGDQPLLSAGARGSQELLSPPFPKVAGSYPERRCGSRRQRQISCRLGRALPSAVKSNAGKYSGRSSQNPERHPFGLEPFAVLQHS
jgi:hypothetical protein